METIQFRVNYIRQDHIKAAIEIAIQSCKEVDKTNSDSFFTKASERSIKIFEQILEDLDKSLFVCSIKDYSL